MKTMKIIGLLLIPSAFAAFPPLAHASHWWFPYHWARTANPFTVKLGNDVSSTWSGHLDLASDDWGMSGVLDTSIVPGRTKPRNCRATRGQVEVCDAAYGNNGWLGVATIWVSGEHITQATAKMNDTYFNAPPYNTNAWRQLVMCQEVGHTFGLDHQDEDFYNPNLGTCMDYTAYPETNQQPNAHDYEELEIIYGHLDGTTTVGQTVNSMPPAASDIEFSGPGQWGRLIRSTNGGRTELYELDFGGGHSVFNFVIWAEGEERGRRE